MDLDELERHLPKDNLEPLVLGTSEKLAMNVSNRLCLDFFWLVKVFTLTWDQ